MKDFRSSAVRTEIVDYLAEQEMLIPTEIQRQAIPILMDHDGDFVGQAPTGTGKTFAYGAPLLSKIDTSKGVVQGVILVPTRELCEQVATELSDLASHIPELNIQAIYGGLSLKEQTQEMSGKVQVVVATPGRLMDLIERKIIYLSSLQIVVFDEADEMLLKGFTTDIDKILSSTNRTYSSWLFSATMPDEVKGVIKKYLHKDLQRVRIGAKKTTNTGITHQFLQVTAEDKLNVLLHFLTRFGEQKGIIFCRTKSGVQKLYKQLSANKFKSGAVHGDLPQGLRNKTMDQFRDGSINLLIATDVAARGIDIEEIAFVIQYHVPDTVDSYTHRSGRTSRAGNTGTSITFVFPEEKRKLLEFKHALKLELEELSLPSHKDQLINKAILWGRKIAKQKSLEGKVSSSEMEAFKKELTHLSKDELIEKLMANVLREMQG